MDAKIAVPLHLVFLWYIFKDEKDCYNKPLSVVGHHGGC
jgi:hypothetical protein